MFFFYSVDRNGIDMTLIKQVIGTIVEPLTYICNLSFKLGCFPSKMKMAKVIPLHKVGEKHLFTNYRPVSLLSQFSNILEKLFVVRLDSLVEKYELLMDRQYGFRTNGSTAMSLMDLVEELTCNIDNKKYSVVVFINLKKAFDTTDHNILIHKLERYGIRGVGLNWLKSYIENRIQFVQMGATRSLSQILYVVLSMGQFLDQNYLYFNDVWNVSKILNYVIFADDTNVFCAGENLQQLLEVVTAELSKLKL